LKNIKFTFAGSAGAAGILGYAAIGSYLVQKLCKQVGKAFEQIKQ
jgi:hypothetical protein